MSGRIKKTRAGSPINIRPEDPVHGTAIAGHEDLDPDGIFRNPSSGDDGGIDLTLGVDYDPQVVMVGFEVHGAQSDAVVMVEYFNGSIGRYGNITIAAGGGWLTVDGVLIRKILCSANGTTAVGVRPLFQ
jgi:hypothetical protein